MPDATAPAIALVATTDFDAYRHGDLITGSEALRLRDHPYVLRVAHAPAPPPPPPQPEKGA